MNQRSDAIVVGAGLGGLAAALRLTGEGLRVTVLDRVAHPGGTAAYYEERGFRFPIGPLGFAYRRIVDDSLASLGLAGAIDTIPLVFQFKALGVDASLAPPLAGVASRLGGLFPEEEGSVGRFFDSVRAINEELDSARHSGKAPGLAPLERSGSGEFLAESVSDWRLERILGSMGTSEPRAGFPFVASLWDMVASDGLAYPAGGFPPLISAMTGALEGSGLCKFRLGCGVASIAVSDGRIQGVSLDDGSTLETPAVVSNADVKTTLLKLLDPDELSAAWREALFGAKLTASGFHVGLGVKRACLDLSAFDGGSRIIYRGGEPAKASESCEIDWSAKEVDPRQFARRELEVDLVSAEDPGIAPPGCAVVLIRAAADHAHFTGFRGDPGTRLPSYAGYKERLARALIEEVALLLPGLPGAISVLDVATPLTYEEMGGRFEGAVAGWSPLPLQMGDWTLRELVRTPVIGLYMAGHQALSWMMLGGVPTALVTGIRAAEALLAGEPPAERVDIPHPGL